MTLEKTPGKEGDRSMLQSPNGEERALYCSYVERYLPYPSDVPLFQLFDRLVVGNLDVISQLNEDNLDVEIVQPGTSEYQQAIDIVNFGYNARYVVDGGDIIDITTDTEENDSVTLVSHKNRVILGTFRISFNEGLETFQLFEKREGWMLNKPSAELSRFALHPILDVASLTDDKQRVADVQQLKRNVLRKLWSEGVDILDSRKISENRRYFILAPSVRRFVESAGIYPERLPDVSNSASQKSLRIRQSFPGYWQPDAPVKDQPAVFLAPREMRPLT